MNYPYYHPQSIKKVNKALRSGKVNYWTGTETIKFEKEFSKYVGNKYSIAVSNGSVALEIALNSLKLKKNDKVIVTPRSFVISASCVLNLGLTPIFADVNNEGNLDVDNIKKVYDSDVKAIIIVHLNGLPCDLQSILTFVKKKKLFLIEDCSQAHGAKYKGLSVGSFGDVSTWSFCQDKIISTGGEGGMISTNNKKIWMRCWSQKDHGKNYNKIYSKSRQSGFKWLHDNMGSNYRMTEIQSILGRYQLKYLDDQIKIRNKIAFKYFDNLKIFWEKHNLIDKPILKCQSCDYKDKSDKKCNKCRHSFYRLNLFINPKKINQLKLIKSLKKNKINCGVGPCPEIYRENIFKKFNKIKQKKLDNANLLGKKSVTLFINPYENLKKIFRDMTVFKKILEKYV